MADSEDSSSSDIRSRKTDQKPEEDANLYSTAYQALAEGEELSLVKVIGVQVHNYSEVRLKLSLAPDWAPSLSKVQSARELIVQAHSSAAMLVWLEMLKVAPPCTRPVALPSPLPSP